MATEILWDGFDGKKLYAERAVCDEIGRNIVETYAVRDDVPSVYNAKLKLQLGNGEAADTGFTANASSDATLVVPLMGGATELAGGTAGLVPAAASEDMNKCLKGDGTWGALLSYTTKDVYDADVYGGIVIETRDGGTRVAILNEHAEYVPAVTATVQSVEFNRSFVPDVMSTVWFPFSFKASELANAHIYKLNNLTYDVESGKYIMGNDDITELTGNDVVAACTPYMISVSASKLEFDFDGDVEINTNEFYPYFVTFNSATHGFIPGGTFTPVDTRISKFGDLPGWGSNQYYGFAGSSSGSSIKNGDFVKVSDTVWVWLFRAYFVHPND